MKIRAGHFALACLLLPGWGAAHDATLILPDFSSLAGKATESVNVSLNPWLLRIAAACVDANDPDGAATKKLLSGIKSIEVRNYTFATDFAYSAADIDAVRRQLAGPGWSQLAQVHDAIVAETSARPAQGPDRAGARRPAAPVSRGLGPR
jgi:hypothetical protein